MKRKIIRHTKSKIDGLAKVKTTYHAKPVSTLPRYKCKNPNCPYSKRGWIPRVNAPVVCPHCHTPWNG